MLFLLFPLTLALSYGDSLYYDCANSLTPKANHTLQSNGCVSQLYAKYDNVTITYRYNSSSTGLLASTGNLVVRKVPENTTSTPLFQSLQQFSIPASDGLQYLAVTVNTSDFQIPPEFGTRFNIQTRLAVQEVEVFGNHSELTQVPGPQFWLEVVNGDFVNKTVVTIAPQKSSATQYAIIPFAIMILNLL